MLGYMFPCITHTLTEKRASSLLFYIKNSLHDISTAEEELKTGTGTNGGTGMRNFRFVCIMSGF